MGKSNRIKINRADERMKKLGTQKTKKGLPNWAMNTIAIVITAVILLGVVAIFMSANGTWMRMSTAMSSENFRVDGNMMTYYYNTKYQNFVSNYSAYLSSLSLDTTKSLKNQNVVTDGSDTSVLDSLIVGDFQGTWFEFFMSETESEVKTMLYYCEEAEKMGIKLTDEDMAEIDESIASIETSAASLGYTTNAYLAASFGEGIKEKDVRNAMKLSTLATKGMNALSEKLLGEVTDEQIAAEYAENAMEYNLVDYTFYTFRVDYDDVAEEVKEANASATDAEILEAYKTKIAEAKAKAAVLLAKTAIKDFEAYLLTEIAEQNYDEEFEAATLPTEGTLNDTQLATIREGMIAQIVAEVMGDKDEADATTTESEKHYAYTVEVTAEYAELFNTIKDEIFDMVTLSRTSYVKDEMEYADSDDFSTWAFNGERKAGDMHKIYLGDGSDESAEITKNAAYFQASVYFLRTPQYQNTAKAKNIAYMTFSTEDAAKAAIEALVAAGTVDQATFDRIASEHVTVNHDVLEDYLKGTMGSTEFDNWVFGDDTKVGSYTAAPIKLDDTTYAVLYYVADGNEIWKVNVKNALFSESYEAYYATFENTYPIKVKTGVLNRVDA